MKRTERILANDYIGNDKKKRKEMNDKIYYDLRIVYRYSPFLLPLSLSRFRALKFECACAFVDLEEKKEEKKENKAKKKKQRKKRRTKEKEYK